MVLRLKRYFLVSMYTSGTMIVLQLRLCELSCSRHGSRVVEVVWRHSEVGCKQGLAQELLEHEEQLKEDFFGKIVLRNCNITHYKSKQAAWKVCWLPPCHAI